jgi:S-DNA-T family DNA segregation ATPase FtsK/SpoIIIE
MAKNPPEQKIRINISDSTRDSLVALLYVALAGVCAMSLLGGAGSASAMLARGLTALTGAGRWLVPLLFLLVAALKFKPLVRGRSVLFGAIFFSLAILGTVDFRLPLGPEARAAAGDVLGGGYIGLIIRFPLELLLGSQAAFLLLLILAVAGILIAFDITLLALLSLVFGRPLSFMRGFVRGVQEVGGGTMRQTVQESRQALSAFVRRPSIMPADLSEDVLDISESSAEDQAGDGEQASLLAAEDDATSAKSSKTISKYKPVPIDLPLSLLSQTISKPTSGDIRANRLTIEHTFQSFGIKVEMGEISVGPTVTQYTLKPEEGVKLSAITALHNDLALALAAHPIRIEAPIPGKSLVGIEVPNQAVATVQLHEILSSDEFQKRRSNLMLSLGKDVAGKPWVIDLERLPHLLVAGSTGSGKSVCLNDLILSLLFQNSPADLRFILVDPKRVEFSVYQHMPHLLTPVITEVPATVNALKWLLREMDRRFILLSSTGDRNIQSYNKRNDEKLPFIILVIDELADLMVAASSEVEGAIIRLAQMARAVGIHLILATQRPSVDVITGLIKANITARIAFSVASGTDSRTILDASGADKLIGRGDMLYVSAEVTRPKRIQCAFVSDEEIRRIVAHLKSNAAPDYVEDVTTKQKTAGFGGYGEDDGGDSLYTEAEMLVVQTGKASASFLQRRLKVGYARAARLLDLLEANGVIGPGDGAKPRDVLKKAEGGGNLDLSRLPEEDGEIEESSEVDAEGDYQ